MAKKYKYTTSLTFDGKRYYVRADSMEELIEKKIHKLRDLEDGKVVVDSSMTVKDWAEICLRTYKTGVKENTYAKYEALVRCCITDHIGSMKLSKVKPINCQDVLNKQAGKSKYQIKQTRQFLNFIFARAKENQLISINPAEYLNEPNGTKTTGRSITDEERKAFLHVTEDDRFLVFLLMYYCGCRPGEAIKTIGADILNQDGYNVLHIRGTKTLNADRLVPIPSPLYNRIKNTPKNAPIAPNQAGNAHTTSSYKRCFHHLKRDMNIYMGCEVYRNELIPPLPLADDFIPYYLRHTFCTDLQKVDIDIRTAQYLMGHSDITMTANIYTHTDCHMLISAAKKIQSF
ncbi:tyrosine-type recombinase/integrase [Senimuribacter intestinalis]|uniref:tyrosine-type recombinase/integrase n=1 Tax=Senimuribacter intestinalis TaxID=2941507 RepID=UPI00203CA7B8|nr:site-specific integrase [Senimuribacter intestinalis]